MPTISELINDAKGRIANLSPTEVAAELEADEALLVDLREPAELEDSGVIPGAIHAPRGMLEFWADPTSAYHRGEFDPERRTLLYCATGGRSALATATLHQLGYENIAHLDGGIKAWIAAGHATVTRDDGPTN